MLNPFFQQGSSGEQSLVQDLINEQLRIYGIDVHYMPRKYYNTTTVIKETVDSRFDDAYPIEAYVESFDGYGDNPTLLSKFGLQATNEITLIISKERFENYISPLMKNEENIKLSTRPKEGDLIYFPLGDRLFEIKYVEHEKPFYQLQKNYVYELRCELFRYEDEVIDTGIDEIDNELIGDDYDGMTEEGRSTILGVARLLYVVGTGTTAQASTSLVNNGIRFISLTNRGGGYSFKPSIGIASAFSGTDATATATINGRGGVGQAAVNATTITDGGSNYTSTPTVTFSDPTGGGNETSIVKFGSRSFDGGDSGTLLSTTGLSASDEGAVEFWFYIAQAPASGTSTIARWGSNDAGNEQYRLDIQTLNGNQIFYHRPDSDSSSGTTAITVTTTFANDLNRWNWIRISQASSGSNQVAVHYMGSSGSFQSTYSSQTFHTQIYNGDGFNLNADGDFSDGEVFVDEVRFTSDGSNTQPSLPTSTSRDLSNTVFFQGGERIAATGTAVVSAAGTISGITVTDGGEGYSSAPTITISGSQRGVTGVGSVTQMIGGITICDKNTNAQRKSVQQVALVNPGTGYTTAPKIKFTGGGGSGAAGTSGISTTGGVGVVTVSNVGNGYINSPTITFSTPKHVGAAATAVLATPMVGGGVSIMSAPISIGSSAFLFPGGTTGGVFYRTAPTVTFGQPTGSGIRATATASINAFTLYGGNVTAVSIGNSGKFYGSVPTVTIQHPGTDRAEATIGLVGGAVTAYDTGSALDNSSVAISTGGKAYSSQPTVTVGLGTGTVDPTTTAVGIATINSIGVVTAISFDPTEVWAVGQGATIGAGYTVAPSLTISLPSPVRATATATVSVAGSVTSIAIGNSGFGYNFIPEVTIEAPAGVSTEFQATGIATIRFNSLHYQGTVGIGSTTITGINTLGVIVGDRVRLGIGYSDSYNFIAENAFVSGIGQSSLIMSTAATNVGIATSVFELGRDQCGIVTGILITYGGGGYITPPTVSISNTVGDKNYIDFHDTLGIATATGISTITSAGKLDEIFITNSGHGYVLTPDITVEAPGSDSVGDFEFNEIVTGSSSGATGRVRVWDASTNILEVASVSGNFTPGETLTGSSSGAQHVLRKEDTQPAMDSYADNYNIEVEADAILDFSEQNPFGTP